MYELPTCEDEFVESENSTDSDSDGESDYIAASVPDVACTGPSCTYLGVPVCWSGGPWQRGSLITLLVLKIKYGNLGFGLESVVNKASFPTTPLPLDSLCKPVYEIDIQYFVETSTGAAHHYHFSSYYYY